MRYGNRITSIMACIFTDRCVLAAVTVCFLLPLSACLSSETQTSVYVTILSQSTILASKLRVVKKILPQGLGVACVRQCASTPSCIYVTADASTLQCSLYVTGCDSVNIVGLTTFQMTAGSSKITTPLTAANVSFYARANNSLGAGFLSYNYMRLNYGSGLDVTNTMFTAPKTGIYWFLYTVLHDGSWYRANITLQGTSQPPTPAIIKNHMSFYGYDVLSRNQIISLTANQQLKVRSLYPTYADPTCGSSFGAFMLDGLMSPLIMFDVYCSHTMSGTPIFDMITYNYGSGWSNCSQAFIAPQAGVYYFGLSVGTTPSSVTVDFQVNTNHYCLLDLYNVHAGLDLVSRGCMLPLNASDAVSVYWRYLGMDSSYGETSFHGFLYSPVHGVQVVWSLHNNGAALALMVVKYDQVLITKNCVYAAEGTLTVQVAGFYYMEIVAHVNSGGGVMKLDTYASGSFINRLYFANNTVPFISRSVPFMAHLTASSSVSTSNMGDQLNGDNDGGISFQGFLLYPH